MKMHARHSRGLPLMFALGNVLESNTRLAFWKYSKTVGPLYHRKPIFA